MTAAPGDPAEQTAEVPKPSADSALIRTSLKLRREVHEYFRDRAHAQKISMQKLIESVCERVYAEYTDQNNARDKRAARKPAAKKETP